MKNIETTWGSQAVLRSIISEALAMHRWHRGKTALGMDVDRKTLFNKMKRYGLLRRFPGAPCFR